MTERRLIVLLSLIAAITVGNLYLAQPLLAEISHVFTTSPARAGAVVTLGQIGYGLGVLLIVPLGDLRERRSLILVLFAGVTVGLLVAAAAPTLLVLVLASLAIGVFTVIPQIVMPYAASIAPDHRRASVIGTVQSGLLIGILLARTVSGTIASAFGWRAVFVFAAVLGLAMAVVVWATFPRQAVSARMSYGQVLRSMVTLLAKEPVLRRVGLSGAANFAVFSGFWTTLPFLLNSHYGYGPGAAGVFGLIGVVGALSARYGGRLSDVRGPQYTQKLSLAVTAASFALFAFASVSLVPLVLAVIVLDAGCQANHISCQAEAFNLDATARSRINGVYMFLRFLGGAIGSEVSAVAWNHGGWRTYCISGVVLCALAYVPYLRSSRDRSPASPARPAPAPPG
jgi:predicted MFS family arabinose efflux permease